MSARNIRRIALVFVVLAALLTFGLAPAFAQGVTGTVTTTLTVTTTRTVTGTSAATTAATTTATTAATTTATTAATAAKTATLAATPAQLPGTGSDSNMTVWPLVAALGLAAFVAGGLLLRRSNDSVR